MSPCVLHALQCVLLHRLADLGLDQRDDELADRLRDEMEGPWRALTAAENRWLSELSAALNAERDRKEKGR